MIDTLNKNQKMRIKKAIAMKENILITGTAGSGKTTVFYSILSLINNTKENTIVIIDDPEVEITFENVIFLLAHDNERQKELLHLIPKLLPGWVGIDEVKGTAALDIIAINTCGYPSIITTKANSVYSALIEFEKLVAAQVTPDKKMIAATVDLIICVEHAAGEYKIKELAELQGYVQDEYQLAYYI